MKEENNKNTKKQQIIDNYEMQREKYLAEGYEEKQEVISVIKANIMAFVTEITSCFSSYPSARYFSLCIS